MTFAAVSNSAPAVKPIALACAISLSLFACAAVAAEAPDAADAPVSTVHVTGARFASDPALLPIGATVITADEIRNAGVTDVNAAIRKIGGVFGRQSLDGSPDFALDLRGFGTNGSQNMVVMVDGVRMNENELTGPILSTIPVDTIERIEITRGGSSVLYGEGATGGVVNIVTKRGANAGYDGSLVLEAGQRHSFDARASVRHGAGPLSFDLAAARQGTHNDRANSQFLQKTVSGGVQWAREGSRLGLRAESARQDARFPGSLSQEQFERDPRQTNTPNDFGTVATDRVTAFAEHRIGAVELAAELSHREREVSASYEYQGEDGPLMSTYGYGTRQTQFSPRLRHIARSAGMLNEFVAGVDLTRWERNNAFGQDSQDARAVYLRDELRFGGAANARVALGGRHEKFEKASTNPFAGADVEQSQNAWTLEGSVDPLAGVTLHAKAGRSYRIPNADENGYRASDAPLGVQTSRDLELGVTAGSDARRISARVFRHRLRNEIFYDPTLMGGWGANTNLDPTRRQGVELDGHADLGAGLRLSAQWQHVQAEFTGGPNAGREMVLVPKNVLTARLAWLPGDGQSADFGAQYVSSQRDGGDFGNTCSTPIPSYTTLDARYARRVGAWEFAIAGQNLADRDYYSNAFRCRDAIYPSSGRLLKLSARYDF